MLTRILFGLILSLSTLPLQAQYGYCQNESVQEIKRPIFSNKPEVGSFNYKFSYIRRENPEATVLIFIPGGPGQTSMEMGLSLPEEFAVVRTDPRSVGCNRVILPNESLTSEEVARDILAIIKEIKPKRYILHGISYGTVVATLVASLARDEKVLAPSAVVLEGTMGRVFKKNEYFENYLKNWKILKQKLPLSIVEQFKNSVFPLGYSSIEWAAWISSMLIYGQMPGGDELLYEYLSGLAPDADKSKKDFLSAQLNRSRQLPSPEKTKLYREIICREMVPDVRDVKYDFDFVAGDLMARNIALCTGVELTRAYDSARYRVQAPLYYFSGALDPATPPSQARYHYDGQDSSKTFISVANGGHQALSTNLMDCSIELWRAIEKNADLSSALQACKQAKSISLEVTAAKKNILKQFESVYRAEVEALGFEFDVIVKENTNVDEASAYSDGKKMTVVVSASYLNNPRLSDDGLRFTLCHEMGHLLGGAPRRPVPFDWGGPIADDGMSLMSAEGEADYYAGRACFRKIVNGQNHVQELKDQLQFSHLQKRCRSSWGSDGNEVLICERLGLGAYNMLQLAKDFDISFATPSSDSVDKTIRDNYPPRQCRLDTALAGALCRQNISLVFDFNNSELSSCDEPSGARPVCWYKKP